MRERLLAIYMCIVAYINKCKRNLHSGYDIRMVWYIYFYVLYDVMIGSKGCVLANIGKNIECCIRIYSDADTHTDVWAIEIW